MGNYEGRNRNAGKESTIIGRLKYTHSSDKPFPNMDITKVWESVIRAIHVSKLFKSLLLLFTLYQHSCSWFHRLQSGLVVAKLLGFTLGNRGGLTPQIDST